VIDFRRTDVPVSDGNGLVVEAAVQRGEPGPF
jgi:hypothetical protein